VKKDCSLSKFKQTTSLPFAKTVIFLASLLCLHTQIFAQPNTIRYYSEKTNETFIGFSSSLQIWTRYTDLNPGSTINGESKNNAFEISIRRYRMQMYAQISAKTSFTFQIGNNDINYNTPVNAPKILDAHVDHKFSKAFAFGIGKSGWTGLSRYASSGTTSMLDFDISFMATPFININDDLLRKMGIYTYGQVKRFDYRVVLSKPYPTPTNKQTISERAIFTNGTSHYQASAYLKYQFRDQEAQVPFSTGTYFGEKNLMNLGAGVLYQPHATMNLINGDTTYHAAQMFSVDLFYETSFNQSQSITIYAAYLKNLLGPQFVRNVGVNNPADTNTPPGCFNGIGNSTPVTGTGDLFNIQLGYLRAPKIGDKTYKVQAFTSIEFGSLEALNDRLFIYDVGLNYFINGHHSKLTLGYQNRPIYIKTEGKVIETQRKSMIVLQYQVKIG
jgi:hypothetical protein